MIKQTIKILFFTIITSGVSFAGDIEIGKPISAKSVKGIGFSIGSIQQSMLSEAQIQAQIGDCWVLANGRSVTGSDYETLTGFSNIPDARGVFLRSKNNGRSDGNENPDGELALGAYQADNFKSHVHRQRLNGSGFSDSPLTNTSNGNVSNSTRDSQIDTKSTGGNETRSKNITVNTFIKINNTCN